MAEIQIIQSTATLPTVALAKGDERIVVNAHETATIADLKKAGFKEEK